MTATGSIVGTGATSGYTLRGAAGSSISVTHDLTGDGRPDFVLGNRSRAIYCAYQGGGVYQYRYFGNAVLVASDPINTGSVGGWEIAGKPTYPMKSEDPLDAGQAFVLGVPYPETDNNLGCSGVSNTLSEATHFMEDIDGDGLSEVLIGSAYYRNKSDGVVFLVLSTDLASSTAATAADIRDLARLTLTGSNGEYLGGALSSADIDGDGLDDIIVSSVNDEIGRVYVVLGRDVPTVPSVVSISAMASLELSGVNEGDMAGTDVLGLWDMDDDGDEEFALSAPGADGGNGVVYIIPGFYEVNASYRLDETFSSAVTPNATEPVRLLGDAEDTLRALSKVGDINGDGAQDLAISAPGSSALSGTGIVYLLYGGADHMGTLWGTSGASNGDISLYDRSQTVSGARFYTPGGSIAEALSAGGDINADGYDEVVTSGPAGTYIFFGGGS